VPPLQLYSRSVNWTKHQCTVHTISWSIVYSTLSIAASCRQVYSR